jgi:phosphoribosyl-ATP pyrophosphohydrolase/phosphoribosyl-AMP cyclohydrolase
MQAFSDRAAVSETLQTGLATFRSRSRGGRWCKGETSGHYLLVSSVHADCDGDSLVYLSRPIGPACHTGAPSCWFSVAEREGGRGCEENGATPTPTTIAARSGDRSSAPLPTLLALERTIAQRAKEASEAASASTSSTSKKPSWTAKLLADPELLCSKVREEADELCRALEDGEGKERVASEAADLLYHAAVLMNLAGVEMEDVGAVLRKRFGTSGVAEKASRKK